MSYINVNNEEFEKLIKEDILLIDIRDKEEYEEKNILNSRNIQLRDLLYNIDDIEEYKEKKVIIYCTSGQRSITACNLLSIEGFKCVYNLEKGIKNYKL